MGFAIDKANISENNGTINIVVNKLTAVESPFALKMMMVSELLCELGYRLHCLSYSN